MTENGTQLTATEEERWNQASAPGGDTVNWSYLPQYGWQYTGNQVDGTAGKSSYINDAGERVHYDSPAGFDQFNSTEMEHGRALNNALDIWSKGGDVFAQEGGRYSAENPYVESPEEALRRKAEAAAYERSYSYDPVTNRTSWGGEGGFSTAGAPKSIPITDEMRARMNDPTQRDYSGVSSFSKQGRDILNEAFNGRAQSPFGGIMGNSEAVDHLIKKFQDDSFNPFYARGREGDKAYDRRSANNIMDYLYKEFGGNDQIANRGQVMRNWNAFAEEHGGTDRMYNRRMDEATFNKLGLDKFKDFNADFSPSRFKGGNPMTGLLGGEAEVKKGGFLDTYLKRKNESKPSVMSLMKELEDT
jgi:hypothetical protein